MSYGPEFLDQGEAGWILQMRGTQIAGLSIEDLAALRRAVDRVFDRYYSAGPSGILPAEPARHAHTARRPEQQGLQPDAPRKADA